MFLTKINKNTNSLSFGKTVIAINNATFIDTTDPYIRGPDTLTPLLTKYGVDEDNYIGCCNVASMPSNVKEFLVPI